MIHRSPSRTIGRQMMATNETVTGKRLTAKNGHWSHSRHFTNTYLFQYRLFLGRYMFLGDLATNGFFLTNTSINKAFHWSPNMCDLWCDLATNGQEVSHGY